MTDLNLAGESYAHSLIAADKVDRASAWSFDAAEVSLVTFPMNELARTGAVKAADIRTVREFEDARRARLFACGRQIDCPARLQGGGPTAVAA